MFLLLLTGMDSDETIDRRTGECRGCDTPNTFLPFSKSCNIFVSFDRICNVILSFDPIAT